MRKLTPLNKLIAVLSACALAGLVSLAAALQTHEQETRGHLANESAAGRVLVGMTAEQCRAAWGAPVKVKRTEFAGGAREQWVYPGGNYLFLDNGELVTVQTRQETPAAR